MSTSATAPSDSSAGTPLLLAIAGGFVQVAAAFACFPRYDTPGFVSGAGVGVAASVGAIISEHLLLTRIKRRLGSGRGLARCGLLVAYLSLLTLPALYYGVSFLLSGMHDSL